MKKLIIFFVLISTTNSINAQKVGIGTVSPAYPLTVVPNLNGTGIVQKSNTVDLAFVTNNTTGGLLKTTTNSHLSFNVNDYFNIAEPVMFLSKDGNLGIGLQNGNSLPAFYLDVKGRARIKHYANLNQKAGIWFDGTSTAARSFVGTNDNDHVGLWGSGGAGWNITMNVENGNTGIGTTAPTANLDINGSLRIRGNLPGNFPKTGSVLVSDDVNGNTSWQAPVAFSAQGSPDGNSTFYSGGGNTSYWAKYFFGLTPDYNLGLHYNPNTSEFVAPVRGLYHFNAELLFENENRTYGLGFVIIHASGVLSSEPYFLGDNGNPVALNFNDVRSANNPHLSADYFLGAGDKVSVSFLRWDGGYTVGNDWVNSDPRRTWFSGHLVNPY